MSSENTSNKVPDDGSGKVSPANLTTGNQVSTGASPLVCRVVLSNEQLEDISLEELRSHWRQQDTYINSIETLNNNLEGESSVLRESEEKLKQQISELALRERALVRRLAAKEQDLQEYANQLSELKTGQAPGIAALRSALLDPGVNVLLQKLRRELAATRTRLDDTQNELAAWKFTPDSNTGKRLMAKCRLLYQENEELGRMISSGRLAKLEGDLALQKSFSEEVKKSQSELDDLLQDLDEDVEGMQSTIYYLQQELRKSKETVAHLEEENRNLRIEGQGKTPSPPVVLTPINGLAVHHNGKQQPQRCKESDTTPRTRETDTDGSVVNDNAEGQGRKRTTSENSDDALPVKRLKTESHISAHFCDDQVITNGEISGQ